MMRKVEPDVKTTNGKGDILAEVSDPSLRSSYLANHTTAAFRENTLGVSHGRSVPAARG